VILGVLIGALILGAAVAYGSWWWNATIRVESVKIHTAWSVVDDPDGADNYHTLIVVELPKDAEAEVEETVKAETVLLWRDFSLECRRDGIPAKVGYFVKPLEGADGNQVEVWVTTDDRRELGRAAGSVNQAIKLEILIPATC